MKDGKAHIEGLPTLQKLSETVTGKAAKGGAVALKDKKYEDMTDAEREVLADEDPELFEAKYTTYLEN